MKNLAIHARLYHYWALKIASEMEDVHKLSEMETFKERVEWAEKTFEHLSSGSSRVIYKLADGNVLKLAKNERGVAQNKAESNPEMKNKYINPTIKYDKEGVWKISPWAEKITEKEFEELIDINFKDFGKAISYGLRAVADNSGEEKPECFEEVSKSDIYKELVKVGKKFDLMPGDIERISSWGQRDGHPVLIDSGLTAKIFEDFYEDDGSASETASTK